MTNKDFILSTYKQLLQELLKADCSFLTLEQYCKIKNLPERFVILRHDVDRTPKNSLKTALIEDGRIKIHVVDDIPLTKSGKRRFLIRNKDIKLDI